MTGRLFVMVNLDRLIDEGGVFKQKHVMTYRKKNIGLLELIPTVDGSDASKKQTHTHIFIGFSGYWRNGFSRLKAMFVYFHELRGP